MYYNYRGKVDRVVDGDTLDINVDLGFRVVTHQRFRLEFVDTPERGKKNYKEATNLLERLISEEKDHNGYITFKSVKTGKYGRWLFWNDFINMTMMLNYPYNTEHKHLMSSLRTGFREGTEPELSGRDSKLTFPDGNLIWECFLYADDDYDFKEYLIV